VKRIFIFWFFLFILFFRPAACFAASDYRIREFKSEITLNQDASLTIREIIRVEFLKQRHGIYRVIPVVYSAKGRTIKADLKVLSVTNETGSAIPYQVSSYRQSRRIRIGDPDKAIIGDQVYIISYQINKVVQRFDDHDEIYWNVTGSEWTTEIEQASAVVRSDYAQIKKTECFAGRGGQEKLCLSDFSENEARFTSQTPISWGSSFTIVVGLDKENQLNFPGIIQKVIWALTDNWGYLTAVFPFLIMLLAWYKKGRDKRYLSDNVYYRPEDQREKTVSPFSRPHLPLVYHPIDNLTPAQVGTILDEKVDIEDIVAEIVELARLGYLEIKKTEKKRLLGKKTDYLFLKKNKDESKLNDYQRYLLESIFKAGKTISLYWLEDNFYQNLPKLRKKLYQNLVDQKIFPASPDKVRVVWLGIASGLDVMGFALTVYFLTLTANSAPFFLSILTSVLTLVIPRFMPRKTAWGYSLHRQAKGLQWYLGKGKWREEISEKHLFLEEMLPLAISLGVVDQLAKDMAKLGVEPPSYFQGVAVGQLSESVSSFRARAASAMTSSPKPSGRSFWSGGSGFSGGGGGGFGGGGGGSW